DRRDQLVSRVPQDGHHERVGEVSGRRVDDRVVTRYLRILEVQDPHRGVRGAARLQAQGLVLVGGGGYSRAQAGELAVGRVLDLKREIAPAAVMAGDRGGHHAVGVEIGRVHRTACGDGEVLRRVPAGGRA